MSPTGRVLILEQSGVWSFSRLLPCSLLLSDGLQKPAPDSGLRTPDLTSPESSCGLRKKNNANESKSSNLFGRFADNCLFVQPAQEHQ